VGAGGHKHDIALVRFDEHLSEIAFSKTRCRSFAEREERGPHRREAVLFHMRRQRGRHRQSVGADDGRRLHLWRDREEIV
jgi:hypothetical protein